MHWSVRSIVVLQIKHHLTSPPSSHLTKVYTMQRLEVQPNYIYHILGLKYHASFEFQGAKMFNNLPTTIRELQERKLFRDAVLRHSRDSDL